MKPTFFIAASIVCALLVNAPGARAQDALPAEEKLTIADVPAAKPMTEEGAREAATFLIAATKRYMALKTFEVVINRDATGGLTAITEKEMVRLRYSRQDQNIKMVFNQKLSDGNWVKRIFDGQTVVDFSSYWPGFYERRAPRPSAKALIGKKVGAELVYADADGPLAWMLIGSPELTDRFTEPELKLLTRFDLKPDGPLQKVTVIQQASSPLSKEPVVNALEMWFDPKTSMMTKSRQYDSFRGFITETYTEQSFNPKFDKNLFRAAAPLSYKLK